VHSNHLSLSQKSPHHFFPLSHTHYAFSLPWILKHQTWSWVIYLFGLRSIFPNESIKSPFRSNLCFINFKYFHYLIIIKYSKCTCSATKYVLATIIIIECFIILSISLQLQVLMRIYYGQLVIGPFLWLPSAVSKSNSNSQLVLNILDKKLAEKFI